MGKSDGNGFDCICPDMLHVVQNCLFFQEYFQVVWAYFSRNILHARTAVDDL